jgi:hypothetical protein
VGEVGRGEGRSSLGDGRRVTSRFRGDAEHTVGAPNQGGVRVRTKVTDQRCRCRGCENTLDLTSILV